MRTTLVRTPVCFLCHPSALVALPSGITDALAAGALMQDVLPKMSRPEREQLISGTHPARWAAMFGQE